MTPSSMDLFSINSKPYKRIFFLAIAANIFMVAGCYGLIRIGFDGLAAVLGASFAMPLLLVMVILAITHSIYQRRQLNRLQRYTDFEERLVAYEQIYNIRMIWFVFSCIVSCILYLIFERMLFLYLAILDTLTALPFYPAASLFRREMKNDEIDIY